MHTCMMACIYDTKHCSYSHFLLLNKPLTHLFRLMESIRWAGYFLLLFSSDCKGNAIRDAAATMVSQGVLISTSPDQSPLAHNINIALSQSSASPLSKTGNKHYKKHSKARPSWLFYHYCYSVAKARDIFSIQSV